MWSNERIRKQGAKYLPELAEGDLYVDHEKLNDFIAECELLINNIAIWADNNDSIKHRLKNFKKAAIKAVANKGGVRIG